MGERERQRHRDRERQRDPLQQYTVWSIEDKGPCLVLPQGSPSLILLGHRVFNPPPSFSSFKYTATPKQGKTRKPGLQNGDQGLT